MRRASRLEWAASEVEEEDEFGKPPSKPPPPQPPRLRREEGDAPRGRRRCFPAGEEPEPASLASSSSAAVSSVDGRSMWEAQARTAEAGEMVLRSLSSLISETDQGVGQRRPVRPWAWTVRVGMRGLGHRELPPARRGSDPLDQGASSNTRPLGGRRPG
jgi:hypothetical protein